jgi:valyl-tRNA synthetase
MTRALAFALLLAAPFAPQDDLAKSRRKLENQSFVANAPEEIVAKENARVEEFAQRARQLEQQLGKLAELE